MVDAAAALVGLRHWINSAPASHKQARAVQAFARLFGRDHSLATKSLSKMPVTVLGELCRFVYLEVSPLDDVHHEGSYTPGVRNGAQAARNAVLSALIDRSTHDAFVTFTEVGKSGIAGIRPTRFAELAHGMAERASEQPAWTPHDVKELEASYLLPIKSGDQFLDAVCETIDAIGNGLEHDDASSRLILTKAQDEVEVQKWLAGEIKVRAGSRYHVHREPQVAAKKKPDIIASAIGFSSQVAIEIKHANKGWTLKQLEASLTRQLAGQYLRPTDRRHGILVITLHLPRTWRDPVSLKRMTFAEVIAHLRALAATLTRNKTGDVAVRVIGLSSVETPDN